METKLTIKDLRPELRPDEKFLKYGPGALSEAELLAIILRTGSSKEHSVSLAEHIISSKEDGSLNILNIFDRSIDELKKIEGVGKVKALQIKALCELSTRISKSTARKKLALTSPASISACYMEQLRHLKREVVVLVMLNAANELIKEETMFEGTVAAALFSPREIFLEALKYEAVRIVLVHNHPSGNPRPSEADILATRRICKAGSYIGIELLDHIVIGDNTFTSLREEGYIEDEC